MDIEVPVFNGDRDKRLEQVERWITEFTQRISALPFEVTGIRRGSRGAFYDELIITYSDGSRVKYALSKS